MPIVSLLFFIAGRRSIVIAQWILIIAGFLFYSCAGWKYIVLLLTGIAITLVFKTMASHIVNVRIKNIILGTGIALHIGILVYIKYLSFLLKYCSLLINREFSISTFILPLGISFITFKQIAYLVDSSKDSRDTIPEYLLYISFFPMLLQGPIALRNEFIPQLRQKDTYRPNPDHIARGIMIFTIGLAKKILLADVFYGAVTWGFDNISQITSMDTWVVMLSYTMQIYFDFSGYCDMAYGSAQIMNIKLPINFHSPYKSLSIDEFWKRWHITLTNFFRNYVYIPLGGNRKGKVHTSINVMIVFLLSGLWHGANMTFLLWGLLHGLLNLIHRNSHKYRDRLTEITRWISTFLLISILWLLFRSDSVGQWISLLFRMFRFENLSLSHDLISTFDTKLLVAVTDLLHVRILRDKIAIFGMLVYGIISYVICTETKSTYELQLKTNWKSAVLVSLTLGVCILFFNNVAEYIYFSF